MDSKTLTDNLTKQFGLKRDETQNLLTKIGEILADVCIDMDTMVIPGFGQFEGKKRQERITVHPSTGKRLLVPPKLVVAFKPSGILKSKLNNE